MAFDDKIADEDAFLDGFEVEIVTTIVAITIGTETTRTTKNKLLRRFWIVGQDEAKKLAESKEVNFVVDPIVLKKTYTGTYTVDNVDTDYNFDGSAKVKQNLRLSEITSTITVSTG